MNRSTDLLSLADHQCDPVRYTDMPLRFKFRRWHLLLMILAFVVLLGVASWIDDGYASFSEQFRRSEDALNRFAAHVTAQGPTALQNAPSSLGYFEVRKPEPLPHGFLFATNYGFPIDWNGLAYSTVPLPEYDYNAKGELVQTFLPIKGNWYQVWRP